MTFRFFPADMNVLVQSGTTAVFYRKALVTSDDSYEKTWFQLWHYLKVIFVTKEAARWFLKREPRQGQKASTLGIAGIARNAKNVSRESHRKNFGRLLLSICQAENIPAVFNMVFREFQNRVDRANLAI